MSRKGAMVTMSTLPNCDYDEAMIAAEESEAERNARLNRLRAWEIRQRFAKIDSKKIRPMAAIDTGEATDTDREILKTLETEAQALRAELSTLVTEVNHEN